MDLFIYFFIIILYIVAIITMYNSLNSFNNGSKVVFVITGMVIMAVVTFIVYSFINASDAAKASKNIILLTFIPLNCLIILPITYRNINKYKNQGLDTYTLLKRLIIIAIIFVIILVFEFNYIKDSINNIENIVLQKLNNA